MVTFEHLMGFLLLVMVVWLIHPLVTQIGAEGLEWTLAFFVAIAFACYLLGKISMTMSTAVRWRYRSGAIAVVGSAALIIYGYYYPIDRAMNRMRDRQLAQISDDPKWDQGTEFPWRRWSPEAVQKALKAGKTVLVDFTAAYCTTCKINKKIAIDTPEVRSAMEACAAVALQGDFSTGDEAIFEELKKHGRVAVPLNLIYRPDRPNDPIVLDISLSKKYLLEKLAQSCSATDGLALGP